MKVPRPLIVRTLPLVFSVAAATGSEAAITYVDPPDITIPFSFGGVYLDIVTAGTNASSQGGMPDVGGAFYTVSYSQPAANAWDINFFFGGAGIAHNATFQPYRADASVNLSAIRSVEMGAVIDGGPIVPEPAGGPAAPLAVPGFGGSGSGTGGGLDGLASPTHMGAASNQFSSGAESFMAFVLDPGTPEQMNGWIRVTLADDGSTGTIHDWAYSDQPLAVGVTVIPEPRTAVLQLASLAAAILLRRRR